ncbi:MAG TPA: glycosyltransferase family 39 protein [Bacteroidales bacterium]|nr:glycosyltransferase family 39 protein [Bacteroidales bacterium]
MNIKILFRDIRFWIFFFFVIRLIGITDPPLEIGHNWRQSTVTMVARNFLEVDNNIFFPRIDIAGEKTGITGMEFPLFNYLIYLVAKIFGYQHWYGRLINLLVSCVGLWFFYKLTGKYFTRQTAFNATIILTVSIWFQFSRKIMPDTFSMSLILASIYYGSNYLDNTSRKYALIHLIFYGFLMMLGTLSKLPSAFLLVVFAVFVFNRGIPVKRKIVFFVVSFIGLLPVVLWYYYWVPYLVEELGFLHFFMGKSISQGFGEIFQNLNETLEKFYETAIKFIAFALFIYGLALSFVKNDRKIYLIFILTFISFLIIIFKAGHTFAYHSYYIVPFVPVMALIAGYGLSSIRNSKLAIILLIALSVEGIANQQHDFRIKDKDKELLSLEDDLNKVSLPDDLILINSGEYPTPMYFAHRKGWVNSNEQIRDTNYIESLKDKGLKFVVILKKSFGNEISLSSYKKVFENEDYCIYEL